MTENLNCTLYHASDHYESGYDSTLLATWTSHQNGLTQLVSPSKSSKSVTVAITDLALCNMHPATPKSMPKSAYTHIMICTLLQMILPCIA